MIRKIGLAVVVAGLLSLGLAAGTASAAPVHPAAGVVPDTGSQDDGIICAPVDLCIQSEGNLAYLKTVTKYGSSTDWICIYAATGCQFEQSGTSLVMGWNNADAGFILEPKVTPAPTWQEFYNVPEGGPSFKTESVYLGDWLYNEGSNQRLGLSGESIATIWVGSKLP